MVKREAEVNGVSDLRLAMRHLTVLACLLVVALAAYGQGANGSITGTITDPSGAVAPNVSIEVKNSDTGAVFQSGTSNTGNYVVSVPAGNYEVTVTATGFKKYVRSNLVVQAATGTRLDVTLDVGAITETITVNDRDHHGKRTDPAAQDRKRRNVPPAGYQGRYQSAALHRGRQYP